MMPFLKASARRGLFLSALALLTACPTESNRLAAKPVLQVNGRSLTAKEFADLLARRLKPLDALSAKDPLTIQKTKEELLQNFVVRSLILDWCEAQNLRVSEADVEKEVEKIRASYPDDVAFRHTLASENLSFSRWRDDLSLTLLQRAFFARLREKIKAPGEEQIHKAYADNRARSQRKERILLRQIVTDDQNKADLLRTELRKGDFSALARKYSSGPEASNGGLVGWVEKGSVDFLTPPLLFPQAL